MLVTLIAAASTAGAKLYLEQTHLPRQRRLCDIEHSRSPRKAADLGDPDEIFELAQVYDLILLESLTSRYNKTDNS